MPGLATSRGAVFGISWILVAALTVARPAFPQASPTVFEESIQVELVTVDVWVEDADGKPVDGLTAADFEVEHNGELVEISHFLELRPETQGSSAETAARESEAPAPALAGSEREYVILYVDQLRLQPNDYGAVLQGMENLLDSSSVPPEHFLILRQTQSLSVAAPFGSSSEQLQETLKALRSVGVDGLQVETELDQAIASLQVAWKEAQELTGVGNSGLAVVPTTSGTAANAGARGALSGGGNNFGPDACDIFFQRIGPSVDGWTRSQSQRVQITLGHLSRVATFLAGLPGIKTVLYVGSGLDLNPGVELSNYVGGLCPTAEAELATATLGEQLNTTFQELTRHLNSNRVTVFPFQTGSLQTSSGTSVTADGSAGTNDSFRARGSLDQARRSNLRAGLEHLAGETGGRRLTQPAQLADLGSSLNSRYSLAYTLPPGSLDSARIRVALREDSWTLRYRRSTLRKDADQRLDEKIEGALYLGLIENTLGARLGAGELKPADEGQFLIPLRVTVPISQLTFLPGTETDIAEISLRVLSRNLETGKTEKESRSFRVKRPEGAVGRSITLPVDLYTDPGPTSLAVGLRDEASGQASVLSTGLSVGPPPGS